MRCLWSHNDQENTRLGHYCLPKAAKKLKVVYCRPVQLAAFKKTFVSGIWLNWQQQQQHVLFDQAVRNVWISWLLSSLFWLTGDQHARSSGDITWISCYQLSGEDWLLWSSGRKDTALCQWTWSLFKVLNSSWNGLWSFGPVSTRSLWEPVHSCGCMRLKLQRRGTALELERAIPHACSYSRCMHWPRGRL